MDTRQLEYIIAIEEERSISRAAERMYVTPSALSQQLKNLEAELKTTLFVRSREGMSLTPEGNLYLSGARAMMEIKRQAMEKIQQMSGAENQKKVIYIALNQNFYKFVQAYIISEFEKRFPYMKLEAVLVTETSAKDEILRGKADIGFIIASGLKATSLESIPLQREPLHLAFPRTLFPEGVSEIPYDELIRALQPLDYISAPHVALRYADLYYLRSAGLDPQLLCYASSYAHLRKLLNLQFAYGIIPEGFIEETDSFSHIPVRPAAYYTLEIVLGGTLAMTQELRELILMFLRTFDRESGGKSMLEALEHG